MYVCLSKNVCIFYECLFFVVFVCFCCCVCLFPYKLYGNLDYVKHNGLLIEIIFNELEDFNKHILKYQLEDSKLWVSLFLNYLNNFFCTFLTLVLHCNVRWVCIEFKLGWLYKTYCSLLLILSLNCMYIYDIDKNVAKCIFLFYLTCFIMDAVNIMDKSNF